MGESEKQARKTKRTWWTLYLPSASVAFMLLS